MNSPIHPLSARDGFSLVELMLVLVVAGIMLGLAAPRLSGYVNRMKVDGAVDEVAAQVAYGQSLAVRLSRPVELRMTQTGTAPLARYDYSIVEIDGSTDVGRRAGSLNDGNDNLVLQVFSSGAAVSLSSTPTVLVRFSPRGMASVVPESVAVTRDGHRATLKFTALGKTYRVN